jgi:Zn-dependent protease with chaperone function
VLDTDQLGAVLAHERAHLAHRDHLLTVIIAGLRAAFPGVPLFIRGAAAIGRLAEMAADDTAARSAGRPALVAALLAMATGAPVPARALAAAGHAVPARVDRLLRRPRPAAAAAIGAGLTVIVAALALIPLGLAALA